jgi:hypothetical protein
VRQPLAVAVKRSNASEYRLNMFDVPLEFTDGPKPLKKWDRHRVAD